MSEIFGGFEKDLFEYWRKDGVGDSVVQVETTKQQHL